MRACVLLLTSIWIQSITGIAFANAPDNAPASVPPALAGPSPSPAPIDLDANYEQQKAEARVKIRAEADAKSELEKEAADAKREAECKEEAERACTKKDDPCHSNALKKCGDRMKGEMAAAKLADQNKKTIEALKPPAELATQLDRLPSGVRLGIALFGNYGATFEERSHSVQPHAGVLPFISFHASRGDVTEAYCAAKKYGPSYAQKVADDWVLRRRAVGDHSDGWDVGVPGDCWNWQIVGWFLGVSPENNANVKRGKGALSREIPITFATGPIVQIDILSILIGVTVPVVNQPRGDKSSVLVPGLGFMVGIGTSFSIGSDLLK